MNNKKKIIDTLRNADKASVEKLMAEEAKKNEIFAKALQRANINNSEYADSVSGVEKYERRISTTRIASIAAAAVLITSSIGGGAYFMNHRKPVQQDPVSEPTTTVSANTDTTSTNESETGTDTTTTSTSVTETEITTIDNTDKQYSITKEELIEKAKESNSVYYFDKFSADFTYTVYTSMEYRKDPMTHSGSIFLDEINMKGTIKDETTINNKIVYEQQGVIEDNKLHNAIVNYVETDYVNGGQIFLDTPQKEYYVEDYDNDKVYFTTSACGRNMALNTTDPDSWEITGGKTENGRTILSVSGHEKGSSYEGIDYEYEYRAEIDAATGMTISYDSYDNSGNLTYTYRVTNYKFDNEAEAFKTTSEILREIENGDYTFKLF